MRYFLEANDNDVIPYRSWQLAHDFVEIYHSDYDHFCAMYKFYSNGDSWDIIARYDPGYYYPCLKTAGYIIYFVILR